MKSRMMLTSQRSLRLMQNPIEEGIRGQHDLVRAFMTWSLILKKSKSIDELRKRKSGPSAWSPERKIGILPKKTKERAPHQNMSPFKFLFFHGPYQARKGGQKTVRDKMPPGNAGQRSELSRHSRCRLRARSVLKTSASPSRGKTGKKHNCENALHQRGLPWERWTRGGKR